MLKLKIKEFLLSMNFMLISRNDWHKYKNFLRADALYDSEFLSKFAYEKKVQLANLMSESRSQLRQDLFVLQHLEFKNDGFFVEVGAADGLTHSNTFLLESKFGWKGILVEPARVWHRQLFQNRSASTVLKECVTSESGNRIEFYETSDAEFSSFKLPDNNRENEGAKNSQVVRKYHVTTRCLGDLLKKNCAPNYIDYLSIDTEGSELEVLKGLDMTEYRFGVITVEHNYSKNRSIVIKLLEDAGYVRVMQGFSKWDDWFVPLSTYNRFDTKIDYN